MTKVVLLMVISMAGILAMILAPMLAPMAKAYSCSSSSSTHNVNTHIANAPNGISGSPGSCVSSSTATNFAKPDGNRLACNTDGPNAVCFQTIGPGNPGQGQPAAQSTSAGGAQSSCSSSSATTSTSNVSTTS